MLDVVTRVEHLRQTVGALHLYVLVDGLQYQTHLKKACTPDDGFQSLFIGTPDAALAHAGPWLIDADQIDAQMLESLATLESTAPALTWLITTLPIDGLTQLLQINLDVQLPNGRIALLRFWDPRVLVNLAEVLGPGQREAFFGHIYEWHLRHNGQRAWIGRHNDYA